jgi:hypothetical protein
VWRGAARPGVQRSCTHIQLLLRGQQRVQLVQVCRELVGMVARRGQQPSNGMYCGMLRHWTRAGGRAGKLKDDPYLRGHIRCTARSPAPGGPAPARPSGPAHPPRAQPHTRASAYEHQVRQGKAPVGGGWLIPPPPPSRAPPCGVASHLTAGRQPCLLVQRRLG